MLSHIVSSLIAVVVFSNVSVSVASDYQKEVRLSCDTSANKFMVRFGHWKSKIPVTVTPDQEKQWSLMEPATDDQCVLSDGNQVSVKADSAQAFPYGLGGGDPDRFLTLNVNGKTAYYKKPYYLGYGSNHYAVTAIIYEDGNLSECSDDRKASKYNDASTQTCVDQSARLSGNKLSEAENKELLKNRKKEKLRQSLSEFCNGIRKNDIDYEYLGKIPSGHLSKGFIDINNDKSVDEVYRIGGGKYDSIGDGTHYFDGSYLVTFVAEDIKSTDFLEYIKNNEYRVYTETNVKKMSEWNALFISGGMAGSSVRYVYNVPFSYNDKNYIYSFESSSKKVPSAVISEMLPDNTLSTVCQFP